MKVTQFIGPGTLEENRVLVTGQLATPADVNQHLQLCDVYLQPSLWDGMPNALLEAMAAGCGCIASDAGGIPEIIAPGVDGIVLPRWQLHRWEMRYWNGSTPTRSFARKCGGQRASGHGRFHFRRRARAIQAVIEHLIPKLS